MSSSLKVAVLGGSGQIGSALVKELSKRGNFDITAVARDPAKIDADLPHVTALGADASDIVHLSKKLKGIDVLLSALYFDVSANDVVKLAKASGAKRVIVVGGAGSLHLKEGAPYFVNDPSFPAAYAELAKQGLKFYQDFTKIDDFDWVVVSPPLSIGPGPALGKYQAGTDILLFDKDGKSAISYADFAKAIVDEIENQRNAKKRITFAY